MLRVMRSRLGLLVAVGLLVAGFVRPAAAVGLTLLNGWVGAPFGTGSPAVQAVGNIVRLSGAIASGSTATAFVLPTGYRPLTSVYVPVDMCNATNGRLFIQTDGTVEVEVQTAFSNAQCFTSLDGVSFARTAVGFTPLSLVNGWVGAPFSTSSPAARIVSGVVHLKGAIASGTSAQAFTLPASFWPSTNVYVPIDLCDAANGRLVISSTGVVSVQAENNFSDAQCFTSLDGASFSLVSPNPLRLVHGWTETVYGTADGAVRNVGGVVTFVGAIATTKTNSIPFTLPAALRPSSNVYIKLDLCNATNGRLVIPPSGVVSVEAETAFSDAQCFTSLDGASFVR